jgi:hypothetical protein
MADIAMRIQIGHNPFNPLVITKPHENNNAKTSSRGLEVVKSGIFCGFMSES